MRQTASLLFLSVVSILNLNCSGSSTGPGDGGGAHDDRVFNATITGGSFGSGGTFTSGCPGQTCSANIRHSSTFFSVYGYDFSAGCTRDLAIDLPPTPTLKTYTLAAARGTSGYIDGNGSGAFIECVANGASYSTDANHVGTATVTSYDASTGTISGTFTFNAVDPNTGLTISVTKGVFTGIFPF